MLRILETDAKQISDASARLSSNIKKWGLSHIFYTPSLEQMDEMFEALKMKINDPTHRKIMGVKE